MVALHHALEDDDQTEIKKINDLYRNGQFASQYKAQVAPKLHKGKTDSEAQSYYGYKLISNGQTGDCYTKKVLNQIIVVFRCHNWCSEFNIEITMTLKFNIKENTSST